MMFLLRLSFCWSIATELLRGPGQEKGPEAGVGAAGAVTAASAAVSDMGQFCARQPDACKVGSQALTQFGYKAQASAKWVYDFLTEKVGPAQTGSAAAPPAPATTPAGSARPRQSTTPRDGG